MNETTPSTTTVSGPAKRVRRHYDLAFKESAVAHCQRHGGDVQRTAQELGLNHWTLRDWMQAQRDKNQPPPPALTLAQTQAEISRLRADLARVTEQREILKKILGHPLSPVMDRRAHIQQLAAEHRVTMLCALLGVSRSAYYDWRGGPGPRQQEDARLSQAVEAVFIEKRRTYGRVRLTHTLRARGHTCGERRVGRLMRAKGLLARARPRFRPQTTDSRHDHPIAPNHLAQRSAPPSRPDEVWVTDFTYIPTGEGWLFLAVVLDRYSRRVVGWAFGPALTAVLARAALQMALSHRRPATGLLHHSDRGCQYASADYRALLAAHGLVASMSRTGNPYDNAAMESFYSTLKIECLHRQKLATRAQAQAVPFDYIETFYNRERIHSALGYKSPVDFEQQPN